MKQANAFKIRVEQLVNASFGGIDSDTAKWAAGLDDKMHARLVAVGLVQPRERMNPTLGKLLSAFFETLAVKPNTLITYRQTRASLESYFGSGKALDEITPLDCDRWRQRMRDAKMLSENPFADVKAGSQTNKARMYFVSCDGRPEGAARLSRPAMEAAVCFKSLRRAALPV
jgi:hypothetical protein